MNDRSTQLMNLPDELLLIILKNLDNIDVLSSFIGLNARVEQLIHEPCFTAAIDFVKPKKNLCRSMDILIDQFCFHILPKIHHLIRSLKVPSTSTKRILRVADYPNLSRLDIVLPNNESIVQLNGEYGHHMFDFLCPFYAKIYPVLFHFEP